MQKLPYVVVTNPHLSHVYELYYKAFERFRSVPEIRTLDDNDKYCSILRKTLKEHLTVIPNLAMGVLECQGLVNPEEMDKYFQDYDKSNGVPFTARSSPVGMRVLLTGVNRAA